LFELFGSIDLQHKNYLTRADLKLALQKLGFAQVTEDQVEEIFKIFDENQDGKISFYEFSKEFAEFQNQKAIKDFKHPLNYIFEAIRDYICKFNKSLAQEMGVNFHAAGFQQQVLIGKDQLLNTLR